MNGQLEYELQKEHLIDNLLEDYPGLRGYKNFINNMAVSSVYAYLTYVINFLNYTHKEDNPSSLVFDDFINYMDSIKKNNEGELTTPSYRISVYSAIKKYGKYLVASDQLSKNPMDMIDRPKAKEQQKTKEKREIGYLKKSETKKYIDNVLGNNMRRSKDSKIWKSRDLAIIMIFLNTGIRCSALMKIDVKDYNKELQTLTVTDKESTVTTYDLSDNLCKIIDDWVINREEFLKGKDMNDMDAMFISYQYNRMCQGSISKVVKKYAKNITGKHITPHKLRATYGTQLYNATHDTYFVQHSMNHKNPKTTELYIHDTKSNIRKKSSDIMGSFTEIK